MLTVRAVFTRLARGFLGIGIPTRTTRPTFRVRHTFLNCFWYLPHINTLPERDGDPLQLPYKRDHREALYRFFETRISYLPIVLEG